MNTKELNYKLLKFAGFTFKNKIIKNGTGVHINICQFPNGKSGYAPDLINSLDNQGKWLIPKIKDLKYYAFWIVQLEDGDYWDYNLDTYKHLYSGRAKNSTALAFALAVEKLIDRG